MRSLDVARAVMAAEAEAIVLALSHLGPWFDDVVTLISSGKGRVITAGIGKSGLIARKMAATLASTGTPSFFLHPTESLHGDLGAVQAGDIVLMVSHSGETAELVALAVHVKRRRARVVAMTSNALSSLARVADAHLGVTIDREACPLGLAPSASTTAAMALGDALAFALLDARGFTAQDFAALHPGGALGKRLAEA